MARRNPSGFTLIELMVAVTIMAIIVAQLLLVFHTQHTTSVKQARVLEVQQDARLVMQVMLWDVQMAGFMVPEITAVSSIDGGANNADVLCVSDPTVLSDAIASAATERFDRASLLAVLGGNSGSLELAENDVDNSGGEPIAFCHAGTTMDLDPSDVMTHWGHGDIVGACGNPATQIAVCHLDSTLNVDPATLAVHVGHGDSVGGCGEDFVALRGIIIANGANTHCALITVAAGNNIDFTPPTPPGFSASPPNARVVPAVIYQIAGGGLTRNGVMLSTQVEDIQAEFGVDLDDNGEIAGAEFPIHDLTGIDTSQVRTIRLSVITRTSSEDPLFPGSGLPAAANRVAGAADGFRRRTVSAGAVLRNLR